MTTYGLEAVLGIAAACLLVLAARRLGPKTELRWYAGALVIAAGVYVAFGLVAGGKPLGIELVQLAVFVVIALLGLRQSPMLIAGGWLLHSIWDSFHVLPTLSQHAPEWYVVACLAFDVPLAAYIVLRRRVFPYGETAASPAID